MDLFKFSEKKIQKLKWWDMSLIKVDLIVLGMIIGALVPTFVRANIEAFVIVFVVLWAFILYRVFQ